jgi:hypothetical protein
MKSFLIVVGGSTRELHPESRETRYHRFRVQIRLKGFVRGKDIIRFLNRGMVDIPRLLWHGDHKIFLNRRPL